MGRETLTVAMDRAGLSNVAGATLAGCWAPARRKFDEAPAA
ncbi:MAG TPA: hypothetical protein VGK74_15495 [Symbiobacteriaceae bacterium]